MKNNLSEKSYLNSRIIMFIITFFSATISVYAQIIPDFSVSVTEGCVPLRVDFENRTGIDTSNTIVRWQFGNGNQSNEKLFSQAVYTQPGEYQAVMSLNINGIEVSKTQKIVVYDNPGVNFYSQIRSGCVPLEVVFFDSSFSAKNTIVNWIWNFGDGTGSALKNPTNTFRSESGNNVTLIVVDDKGCKNAVVKENYIITTQQPVIDFTYSDTVTCSLPLNVRFEENIKSNYPTKLSWDFGNGNTSVVSRPVTRFTEEKTYPVTLLVENNYGCKNTLTKNVTISEEVFNTQILSNAKFGCTPFAYQFSAVSNFSVAKYEWEAGSFKSQDSSGVFVFTQAGRYDIKLTTTDALGCTTTAAETIIVAQKPVADFTIDNTEACIGPMQVNFQSLTSDAIQHLWTFNNGVTSSDLANPAKTLTRDGVYNVQYVATNAAGCSDTILKRSAIKIERPVVNIVSSKDMGCVPFSSEISLLKIGAGEIKNVQWTYTDGTQSTGVTPPAVEVNVEGGFGITALVEFEGDCPVQTVSKTLNGGSLAPFVTQFSPEVLCVKEAVTGNILNPSDGVKYTWHFGDGGAKEGINVLYEYGDVGKFDVYIIAEKSGCVDSVDVKTVEILLPQANFTVSKLCNNGEYRFTNRSLGNSISRWNFGDGTIVESNNTNINHTFADTGTYKVKLYVENFTTKCKDSLTVEVVFNEMNNNIVLEPQKGCTPYTARFSHTSNEYRTIRWDFGDTTITGRSVGYTYNEPGVYDVTVIATRSDGCQETYRFPKIVTAAQFDADFDFDPIGGCAPIEVNFQDRTVSNYSKIVAWDWNLGGLGQSSDSKVTHTFNENTDVSVRLIATDEIGCKDTVNKTVPIYIPKAEFKTEFNSICTDVNFSFENQSIGVGLTYFWTFSNGIESSTEEHPVRIFSKEGSYDVKLAITDANNCKDSITYTSYLKVENYHYDFDGFPRFKTCPELITKFEVFPSDILYKHALWDFGNGNQSLDTNRFPVNIYAESGVFDVKLIIEDYRGCKDTLIKEDFIEVKGPRGKLSFSPVEGCLPLNVQFEADFIDSKFNFWDFGTGVGRMDNLLRDTASHIYTEPGIAIPSLMLDDGLGCVVQLYYDTIFVSGAKVAIDASRMGICTGGEVIFNDVTQENEYVPIASRKWEFSNGATDNGISSSQIFEVDSTKIIYATLTVETELGCIDKDSVGIKVFAYPSIEVPDQLSICKGDGIRLEAEGAENYRWEPARFVANPSESYPVVSPIEDTWFKLIGYDTSICVSYDSVLVKVVNGFDAFAGPDTVLCLGSSVNLKTEVSEIHSGKFEYTWRLNNEIVSKEESPVFLPEEDAAYIVHIKNGSCKEYSLPVYVRVSPLPNVEAYRDSTISLGQSMILNASSDQEVSYLWTPEQNISCANCYNPTVSPVVSTNYKVVVTNDAGCQNEAKVFVEVVDFCSDARLEIPNVFSPNNDGLNDFFRVKYDRDLLQMKSMRVYNRYGEVLFETKEAEAGWDGTFNKVPVNTGVYVYYLEVDCYNGFSKILKGNVTLMR